MAVDVVLHRNCWLSMDYMLFYKVEIHIRIHCSNYSNQRTNSFRWKHPSNHNASSSKFGRLFNTFMVKSVTCDTSNNCLLSDLSTLNLLSIPILVSPNIMSFSIFKSCFPVLHTDRRLGCWRMSCKSKLIQTTSYFTSLYIADRCIPGIYISIKKNFDFQKSF